jgi:hypothetical protein
MLLVLRQQSRPWPADEGAEMRLFRPTDRRILASSSSILHRDECAAGADQAK